MTYIPIQSSNGYQIQNSFPIDDRTVKATIADRNGITPVMRYAGLTVYVIEDSKNYQLANDLTTWSELTGGIGIDDGIEGDVVYWSGSAWVAKQSPIVYIPGQGITKAKTQDALVELELNGQVRFGTASAVESVSIKSHATAKDPLAVNTWDSANPVFHVTSANLIKGMNAANAVQTLFDKSVLAVKSWKVGADSITLTDGITLASIESIIADSTITLTNNADIYNLLKLDGTVDDGNAANNNTALLTLNPTIDLTVDKTSVAYNGIVVDPTISDPTKIRNSMLSKQLKETFY